MAGLCEGGNEPRFKMCHGSLYVVTWLVDEPKEFNLPTLPQRCITYLPEKLPTKYGVHLEECKMDNRDDLELNGLHQLLVYTNDVTMLGENPQTVTENTGILLEASKGMGLEVNPEKVLLYGCETWTLTLREEQSVFENKVLRKIFGSKRDEVAGEWRKLYIAELHAFYSTPDIIRNIKSRRLRWAGHIARMDESRNAYRVLVGRPEGKRSLERPRRRWEDYIKMDLRDVGYDGRGWINLAQDKD
ncbi:hypothetical protein ANN_15347 [Periplaneta americana]|uniref:Reverse transcriptase domain-containing protein n=1 Tax=Periplaneta americana TaxID=6978 RepID=A0ABQ8SG53_PERAM|nr:hypothetical protein ANN_15347 [Periplaneta americana]